jgi:hypothetical protein
LDASIDAYFLCTIFLKCSFTSALMTTSNSLLVMSQASFFDVYLAKESLCVILLFIWHGFVCIRLLGVGVIGEWLNLLGGRAGEGILL